MYHLLDGFVSDFEHYTAAAGIHCGFTGLVLKLGEECGAESVAGWDVEEPFLFLAEFVVDELATHGLGF